MGQRRNVDSGDFLVQWSRGASRRTAVGISAADEEIIRKAAKEINERVLKYKTGNTEPEPFYFLAYVSLLHTIKMLQQEQKFNEIEQINLKLDEFIKE